jgi:hypothetical protein
MSGPRKARKKERPKNGRLRDEPAAPLIGYMRVSKADGSQVLDLQGDALSAAGVSERHLYSDKARGSKMIAQGLPHAFRLSGRAIHSLCGSWTGWDAAFDTSSMWCMTLQAGA